MVKTKMEQETKRSRIRAIGARRKRRRKWRRIGEEERMGLGFSLGPGWGFMERKKVESRHGAREAIMSSSCQGRRQTGTPCEQVSGFFG
jgi:hypothetical protein